MSSIIENIPIYYINLNRSTKRKEVIENYFHQNNLTFKRIEAVDGNDLNVEDLKKIYKIGEQLNSYELGCIFSHIKVAKEILNDGHEYALVLEDDCNFEYLKHKTLPLKELVKLNNEWEIIQLAVIQKKRDFRILSKTQETLIKLKAAGTMAYLINRNGILKFLKKTEQDKNILLPCDYVLYNSCNTLCCKPYFTYFYSENVESTIKDTEKHILPQNTSKRLWDKYYFKC